MEVFDKNPTLKYLVFFFISVVLFYFLNFAAATVPILHEIIYLNETVVFRHHTIRAMIRKLCEIKRNQPSKILTRVSSRQPFVYARCVFGLQKAHLSPSVPIILLFITIDAIS